MSEHLLSAKNLRAEERNYGIDLLRILSMLMIVLLHVNNFVGLLNYYNKNSLGYIFVYGSEAFAICAVNVYAMISGYVLLSSKFKLRRILQLYSEVLFFNFLSYILIIITKAEWNGFKDFIKDIIFILPLNSDTFWYFKAYFLLFFIYPLLNIAIKNMSRRHFWLFFAVIAVFICFLSNYVYDWGFGAGYSFVWLTSLYFIGAYFRRFGLLKLSVLKSCLIYCILSLLIIFILIVNNILPLQINTASHTVDLKYNAYAYTSIFVVLQAVFLFNAFAKIQIRTVLWQKVLLFISPLTFGIYIVHSTKFGKGFFKYFSFITDYSAWLIIPLTIGSAMAVFIMCAAAEWIKQLAFKYARIDTLINAVGDFVQNKISVLAKKIDEPPCSQK